MKNKLIKLLIWILLALALVICIGLSYVKFVLPDVGPAPDIKIEGTTAQIERGAYLANTVMVCMQCHSQRDWTLAGAPSKAGTKGMGGEVHDHRLGFPGSYVSPNLTPYHLSDWTDGEIYRAITSGVNKDGKALFPIMPHPNFGKLDTEDIKSVIAYLRTLQPINYETPVSTSDFPMNFIINMIPQKAQPNKLPSKENQTEYGKYLVTAGSCFDCHTNQKDGAIIGPDFAGGMEFTLEDGSIVRSSNITPHLSGIGSWNSDQFVNRFKMYTDSSYIAPRVGAGDFQTVMPWYSYANMHEDDLEAIFAYLNTLTPIENKVERFTPIK